MVQARHAASETELLVAVRDALAKLPGVLLWRNNVGRTQDARGRWITYGLGIGSADLVGLVTCECQGEQEECGPHASWCYWANDEDMGDSLDKCGTGCVARFFALEVKTTKGVVREEQACWASAVRKMGGFCATVRSVQEAIDAIASCRRGETS